MKLNIYSGGKTIYKEYILAKLPHTQHVHTYNIDRHIQVKNNEIVDSGSLEGHRVNYTGDRYMQVNLTVHTCMRDSFWEVVQ